MTIEPGTPVVVPAAGVTGRLIILPTGSKTHWSDGTGTSFGLVAVEDPATGEVRFFRQSAVVAENDQS